MIRRKSRNDSIQLTPMIDIMATLLAVFMFTTPMMTNGIDLDLPVAGDHIPSSPDHAVILSVDKSGRYFLGEDQMPIDKIIVRLAHMRNENPKISVMIAGDVDAGYGAVMRAMGGLKDAGFENVSLQTKGGQ